MLLPQLLPPPSPSLFLILLPLVSAGTETHHLTAGPSTRLSARAWLNCRLMEVSRLGRLVHWVGVDHWTHYYHHYIVLLWLPLLFNSTFFLVCFSIMWTSQKGKWLAEKELDTLGCTGHILPVPYSYKVENLEHKEDWNMHGLWETVHSKD